MLTVICIIFFIATIILYYINRKKRDSIIAMLMFGISLITLILLIDVGYKSFNEKTIDEQVRIYEDDNKEIAKVITEYIKNTYNILDDNEVSPKGVLTLYPELETNSNILDQIKLYAEKDERIKELKIEKSKIGFYNWLLYFGK